MHNSSKPKVSSVPSNVLLSESLNKIFIENTISILLKDANSAFGFFKAVLAFDLGWLFVSEYLHWCSKSCFKVCNKQSHCKST